MIKEIIIQLIGGLGILASIISFQCKKHNSIMIFRTLNETIFAVQYILLGAYTGTAMNLIGSVRNILFAKQVEKGKSTKLSIIIFSLFFAVFGLFTWQGPKSILIIVAKILSTLAYGNKNTTVVRAIVLVTSSCWLIYNLAIWSVAGALCEAFTLGSLVVGIVRLDIVPALKKSKSSFN